MNRAGREVAVVGVGYSDVTRRGEPDIRTMTRDAALDALDDAGLVATDLDAIFEYSFGMMRGDSPIAVGAQRLLGVPNLTAFNDIMGTGPSGLASAMDAAMAIAAGACETALVYRTITREAGHNGGLRRRADARSGADAVRRALRLRGRDHSRDGDEEASSHCRARRFGRGLRPDRAQRAALGRPVSTRDVPRADHDGRLSRLAGDRRSARALRLRLPGERGVRGHPHHRGACGRSPPARGARGRARLRHREPARLALHRRLPLRRHHSVRPRAVAPVDR